MLRRTPRDIKKFDSTAFVFQSMDLMKPARTLILIRHGKSSWKDADLADFDRPLNHRGRTDGPRMAAFLTGRVPLPDRVLCSPSRRTRATMDFLLPALGDPPPPVDFDPRLYGAEVPDLIEILADTRDTVSAVLLLGHNPALTQLHNHLVSDDPLENLPTLGVAVVQLDLQHWANIARHPKARRTAFYFPKGIS